MIRGVTKAATPELVLSQSHDFGTPTLRDYVRLVWMRMWLVVAVVLVCAAAAFFVANSQTRIYEASARLMYQPPANVSDPTSGTTSVDSNMLSIQLQSVIDTIDDPTVRARAEEQLGTPAARTDIKVTAGVFIPKDVSGGNSSSNLVEIKAEGTSPSAVAATANAYAAAVIALRKEWEQQRYRAAQEVVQNQLKLFSTAQSKLTADYVNLVQQLGNLQIADATATGDFRVVVPATPPGSPVSPQPWKSAALGVGVGLLAGIGIAFLLGRLDTRVRRHREAAGILGQPVLGRLPHIRREALRDGALVTLAEPDGTFSEALRMLRSNLDWASIDDHISSLLVTSCIKGEGKTLTVCNLAVTLARAGKKVIVVDADLRDPQVHRVLNVRNGVGLTSVALGKTEIKDALQVFNPSPAPATVTRMSVAPTTYARSPASASPWVGNLRILTSGPLPPDPGEVVASRSVAAALTALNDLGADYVLVDAPPILGVGDAAALSTSVDGLLIVVNLEKAQRSTLADGREQLDALPCRKVGIIVVGERIDHEEYYRYKTDHAQEA